MYKLDLLNITADFAISASELDFGTYPVFTETGDDYAGDTTTMGFVAIDGVGTAGSLNFEYDSDWFAFTISVGESVRFEIDDTPGLSDFWNLQILNENGDVLARSASNPSFATNEHLFFTADISGTFYVAINSLDAFDSTPPPAQGDYIISGFSVFDDYADDSTTTGAAVIDGRSLIGEIDKPDDVDWIAVDVVEDQEIEFSLARTIGSELRFSAQLVDGNGDALSGTLFALNNDITFNYIAESTGTIYLEISASGYGNPFSSKDDVGGYDVRAVEIAPPYNLIIGTTGHDYLQGTVGQDEIDGSGGDDVLKGYAGDDKLFGGNRHDTLFGHNGDDDLFGENGRDKLIGGNGEDFLSGGVGNDILRGGNDADTMLGGSGNDRLWGEDGDDYLFGSDGNDTLYGGDGYDVFAFSDGSGIDQVMDFNVLEDFLDFRFHSEFNSKADVMAAAFQYGTAVIVLYGTDEGFALMNTQLSDLDTDGAFLF